MPQGLRLSNLPQRALIYDWSFFYYLYYSLKQQIMTVADLKKKIQHLPDNMDVFIRQSNDEFGLSMLEEAEITKATFSEDEGGPVLDTDEVLLLTDEI